MPDAARAPEAASPKAASPDGAGAAARAPGTRPDARHAGSSASETHGAPAAASGVAAAGSSAVAAPARAPDTGSGAPDTGSGAPGRAMVRAEAARIRAAFEATGAEPFEAGILQPAGPLLDLYGEDIRARAYVTADPLLGERMLRPDFTVAVARAHLARGAAAARYAYAGEVFRRQEVPGRPSEYLQVGLEILDPADPPARDAEVFAAVLAACDGVPVEAVTGDMGLLMAAVRGLDASERRRAMLLRHVWRPARFRALLDRFGRASGREVPPEEAIADAGPEIGERGPREVAARLRALRRDGAEPPLPEAQIEALGALLALRGPAGAVLGRLRALGAELAALAPAADAFARRLDALAARGVDADALAFEASLGHATMEYYDGFVFQLRARERPAPAPGRPGPSRSPDPAHRVERSDPLGPSRHDRHAAAARPERPPIASGGRYDALVRALGGDIPAVGAILRPAELLAARA